MDDELVDRVGEASETWADDDAEDRLDSLAGVVDEYLASEGDDTPVTVVSGDLGGDAGGYYDAGSNTITVDDSTLSEDNFQDALASTLHETLHAEEYHETGSTYPGNPADESGSMVFTAEDLENFDPDGPEGYGAMVGDTLVIEAAEEGYPPGHQMLDVESKALAAELMSKATGSSSEPGVATSGGGSEPGESNTIVITEPLFEFDFSQP